jgi:hypothetical protein
VIIRDDNNWVEIEAVDRVASRLPTPGDVEVSVAVCSEKFAGQGFAWLDAGRLATFLKELEELERVRHGAAEIQAMSADDFRLRIWSVDRRGHIAIGGMVSKIIRRGEAGPYRHTLEFGFEFDPTLLPRILVGFREIALG